MTVHGYSDRINHALAFAAKYYGTVDRPGMTMAEVEKATIEVE